MSDEPDRAALRAILEAAVRGEAQPLGDLLETYRPRLNRMVGFRMDERLRGRLDPNDVVQDSFSVVVDELPRYLEKSELDFYLWVRLTTGQTLQRLHRHHLGTLKRAADREVPAAVSGSAAASSFALTAAVLQDSASPSRHAIRHEAGSRLREAIESMREIDREILVLRHIEHLGNGEVAQLLGLSESTAAMRHVRALLRLRDLLAGLGIESSPFS